MRMHYCDNFEHTIQLFSFMTPALFIKSKSLE